MANSRLCSVPDCGKPHNCRGFCKKHYKRWTRHGDPLGGFTEIGAPLRFYNDVVLSYAGDGCLTWPYARTSDGYGAVTRDGKTAAVSRLLCEDMSGPPPTPDHQAAHECGNGHLACVAKGHISWKTPTENQADRLRHGTHVRGERNKIAKLTEPQVRAILSLKGKETHRQIAARYGVAPSTIYCIHTGRNWGWVQP